MTSSIDNRRALKARAASLVLPENFVFGAATAAYQIEGAPAEDGKGESIWDRFCKVPGVIIDGSSGAIACDSYHRWKDDIAILKELGLSAYRFSFAWTRLMPEGRGAVNAKGVAFYNRLIDDLLAAGIEPYATLYQHAGTGAGDARPAGEPSARTRFSRRQYRLPRRLDGRRPARRR